MSEYVEPVSKLLTLASEEDYDGDPLDIRELGIGREHIPELLRMLEDPTLVCAADEDAAWAPIFALEALTELNASEAAEPLLRLLRDEENEWAREDATGYFSTIGPSMLPLLAAGLREEKANYLYTWAIIDAIGGICAEFPERRTECLGLLTDKLDRGTANDPVLNGAIISCLLDLEAVDAAPAIERAFAANAVDPSIAGDWPVVRFELGLGPPPARRVEFVGLGDLGRVPKTKAQKKGRTRNKMAKQSRKKNRKKKKR